MVEKMGHKKRMQMMRMEWINEGKPRSSVHEDSLFNEPALPAREKGEQEKTAPKIAPIFEKRASERPRTPIPDTDVDMVDDIYDATPRPRRPQSAEEPASQIDSLFGGTSQQSIFGSAKTIVEEGPDEDELDALMGEFDEETIQRDLQPATASNKPVVAVVQEIDDDEMEAMAEMDMGDMW
jgi:replication fork protection complex subunit Csm3/Swi3